MPSIPTDAILRLLAEQHRSEVARTVKHLTCVTPRFLTCYFDAHLVLVGSLAFIQDASGMVVAQIGLFHPDVKFLAYTLDGIAAQGASIRDYLRATYGTYTHHVFVVPRHGGTA